MIDFRSIWPLLAALLGSVGAFVGLSWVDDRAQAAHLLEMRGLTRGAFVDRSGKPLAYTAPVQNHARRVYALADLEAALGYRDPLGTWHGLEARYNSFLDGAKAKQDWRTFFLHLRGEAVRGGRVRLTLDREIQQAADAALGRNKGAVVALDPRTGAVLAFVSKPYCSPNALASLHAYRACEHSPDRPLWDRATQMVQPPGSAFKIVTLTAAMDTQRFHLSDIFRGADAWGPSPYFDNSAYPSNVTRSDLTQLTLLQALAFSDNFSFAHIGLTLGGQTLLRYAHRYFLGRRIPFTYPVAVSSIANGHADPSFREVAQSSFGAEVDHVTPLQMALVAATVANGGVMMAPHLLQDLEDRHGKVLQRYKVHILSHVMSGRAARDVTSGMVFVVDHGSGYRAQIGGMKVAGKTGTAASGGAFPHAWFIAFAPADHPIVAVAVLREYAGEAFKYAAPIARKVLIAALRRSGYRVH